MTNSQTNTHHNLILYFLFHSQGNLLQCKFTELQDILGLKEEGHMNRPGTVGSPNWEWKLKDYKRLTKEIGKLKKWLVAAKRTAADNEAGS